MTRKIKIWNVPADFADRFPDGDYTVGRGADPRGRSAPKPDKSAPAASSQGKPRKAKRAKKSVRTAAE